MSRPRIPYGLWPSPVTPAALSLAVRLRDLTWDTAGGGLVWLEGRSDRGVLVHAASPGEAPRDLTGELSVRAQVGYGGGDMTASHGRAFFVAAGRIYARSLNYGDARPITPAFGAAASPTVSPDGRWLIYVHSYEGVDSLAVADTSGARWPQRLTGGDDFYMQPAWHPSGERLAWVSWRHPHMPWDGTRLTLATLKLDHGIPVVTEESVIAGDATTAILQPAFSPDGRYLAYISDTSGWDNLYLYDLLQRKHLPLVLTDNDLGAPAWSQGVRTFAWSADGSGIYYRRNDAGFMRLWWIDVVSGSGLADGQPEPVPALQEYTEISQPAVSPTGELAAIVSAPDIPTRIVVWSPQSGATRVVARSEGETVPPELFSRPKPVSWTSKEGDAVHGLFYQPLADRYDSPGSPPLIVMVHGGPTGQSTARYAATVQFFTTRGYAVLELNYRGSSGYGRDYRNQLCEQWGICDADDAVSGARYLAGQGLVAPDKMVIMGGSAGGYTVLQSLIRYPGTFRAGLCLYGVTNLFTLATDTHKFEQHYLDTMVGPLPEMAQRYRERSPIFGADRIVDPVAIFQGEEDTVVPVSQAETIVQALRRNGVPHEYHLYPGEGHGWRKTETIAAFYEAVLAFLKQYVLFG
jgi:dipeptidyl aminopeptidase/acylaminoacyl peptidase